MGCCCIQNHQDFDQIQPNMTDSKVILNSQKQAIEFKQQGNEHYKKKSYQNAIRCYLQAIKKNPNQTVYYTNLALAYRANNQHKDAITTIDRMLSNPASMIRGQKQLVIKGKITKARSINGMVKKYIIKNEFTKQQSQKMGDLIKQSVHILNEVKSISKIQVSNYLNDAIKIDAYLQKIRQNTEQNEFISYLKKKIRTNPKPLHHQKHWNKISNYFQNQQELLKQVEKQSQILMNQFLQETQQDEQYIIDPITYQKFNEPVLGPSGISYEQTTLKQYFLKGQYKDPITKQKYIVGQKVLVHNNNLKDYIHQMKKVDDIKKEDIEILAC